MRATINLPDALGEAAKAKAAAEGRTFTSIIEEGLRAVLEGDVQPRRRIRLASFGDPKDRPLVELADREALWNALDADGFK